MACFNGKSIWESFCREILPGTYKKRDFAFGRQDIAPLQGIKTVFYVMASSSARCAAFPTAETKLPFFREVKNIKGRFNRLFRILIFFRQAEKRRVSKRPCRTCKHRRKPAEIHRPRYQSKSVFRLAASSRNGRREGKKREETSDRRIRSSEIKTKTHGESPATPLEYGILTVVIQTKKDDGPVIPQHRLAGGGISTDMLKDPSENERMERVRKYDFSDFSGQLTN